MDTSIKILIADENATQRQALCNELRRAGFNELEEATNGEEALIKIGRYHPDVAIIDIWLSKLDGIGVLRNCKSLNFAPDIAPSFIIVSMVSNQSIFMEATKAGADLCHLRIDRDIVSCPFQILVERCLDRTPVVNDNRGELALPHGIPIDGRDERRVEVDCEVHSFEGAQYYLECLCVIQVLLYVTLEERVLAAE